MGYRAFVSSTFQDLKAHRAHVIQALRKGGISVDPMEDWTADTDAPRQFSQDRVAGCDLCVLLVAFRLGHIPVGDTRSITQLEYQAAAADNIDVLVFLLEDGAAWPEQYNEFETDSALREWRAELKECTGVGVFNQEPTSIDIAPALTRWVTKKSQEASRGQSVIELERDLPWLQAHSASLEQAFVERLSGGGDHDRQSARGRYVELLVKDRGPSQTGERPLAELAGSPGCHVVLGEGGSGKTTGLLRLAVDAAARALADPRAAIPLFLRLNFFDNDAGGLDRLLEIAGDAAGLDQGRVKALWRQSTRPILFLLDGFNDVPRPYQAACLLALQELIQIRRHTVRISSRPEIALERLASQGDGVKAVEIVALSDDQIGQFLARHGAGAVFARMEDTLKGLCRNPFMVWALAQSCRHLPPGELPANKGQLYLNFVDRYIFEHRELTKLPAPTRYNYALVKKPILARLALTMTREGVLRRPDDLKALNALRDHLREIRQAYEGLIEITEHDLMPDAFSAKGLLDEIVTNGIIRRAAATFEFMHQSVQDWFAAVALHGQILSDPVALTAALAEVPQPTWVRSAQNALANARKAPTFDALVMLSGLLDDSDPLVSGLLPIEPVLAAECLAAAQQISEEVRTACERAALGLLSSADENSRYAGCEVIRASKLAGPATIERIGAILLDSGEWLGCRIVAITALWAASPRDARSLCLKALATSTNTPLALAAVTMITRDAGSLDFPLIYGIAALPGRSESSSTPVPEAPELLRDLYSLHETDPGFEGLVDLALGDSGWEPAFLLLRMLQRDAAVRRFTEVVWSHGERDTLALLRLPLMCISEPIAQTLLDVVAADATSPAEQMAAGIGLASISLQARFSFAHSRDSPVVTDVMATLFELMQNRDTNPERRFAAAIALAKAGDDDQFAAVLRAISDPGEDQTFRVFMADIRPWLRLPTPSWLMLFILPKYGREDRIADVLLEEAFTDPDPEIRAAAARGLATHAPALRNVTETIDNPASPSPRRAAAIDIYGIVDAPFGIDRLVALLKAPDETPEIRERAMIALARLKSPSVLAALEDVSLRGPDADARMRATLALYIHENLAVLDRFAARALDSAADLATRLHALEAMSYIEQDEPERVRRRLGDLVLALDEDTLLAYTAQAAHRNNPAFAISEFRSILASASEEPQRRERAALALAYTRSDDADAALDLIAAEATEPFLAGTAAFARACRDEYKTNQRVPNASSRRVSRAFAHLGAGSAATALPDLDWLVEQQPSLGHLLWARSLCLRMLDRPEAALEDAVKALETAPDDPTFQSNLGDVYRQLKRYDDALVAYQRVAALHSGNAEAHAKVAATWSQIGNAREALKAAREAVGLAPENAGYLASLGWYAYEAGELADAVDASRRATVVSPEPMTFFNLGLALLASGEPTEACEQYDRGVEALRSRSDTESAEAKEGALGDLVALAGARTDLADAVQDVMRRLGPAPDAASAGAPQA